ncbi:hypothetical protein F2P81_018964 [Scophthalmus maximus]|uniref:Uncharacterized protein n=1 Tax=Scophthalmus maximus TaxID=52904 RepID=A0A6A4SB59_SCOMX|nr:hypothetical protein F2P81_018964 [Scophthalmus maximus]
MERLLTCYRGFNNYILCSHGNCGCGETKMATATLPLRFLVRVGPVQCKPSLAVCVFSSPYKHNRRLIAALEGRLRKMHEERKSGTTSRHRRCLFKEEGQFGI